MNYEMLEAAVVTKIADLRKAEDQFERSLKAAKAGIRIDLNSAYRRLHAQMSEVEQLMAELEATPSYATFPAVMPAQTAAPLVAA